MKKVICVIIMSLGVFIVARSDGGLAELLGLVTVINSCFVFGIFAAQDYYENY